MLRSGMKLFPWSFQSDSSWAVLPDQQRKHLVQEPVARMQTNRINEIYIRIILSDFLKRFLEPATGPGQDAWEQMRCAQVCRKFSWYFQIDNSWAVLQDQQRIHLVQELVARMQTNRINEIYIRIILSDFLYSSEALVS